MQVPCPATMFSTVADPFSCLNDRAGSIQCQSQPITTYALPVELQMLVTALVPTSVQRELCLVSRHWRGVALSTLYGVVNVYDRSHTDNIGGMFLRSIIANSALGVHVLSLKIYIRYSRAKTTGPRMEKMLAPALRSMQNLRHLSLRTLHFALAAHPTCEAAVKGLTNLRSFESASCGLEGNSVMSRLIAILPLLRRLKWDQVGDVVTTGKVRWS